MAAFGITWGADAGVYAVDFSTGMRVRAIGATGGEDVEPADLYVLEDGQRVIPFRLDGLIEIGRAVEKEDSINGWLASVSLAQVGGIGDDLSLLPRHTFHATAHYDETVFAGGPHSYTFADVAEYDAVASDIREAMPVLLYYQRQSRAVDDSRYRPTLCVEVACPSASIARTPAKAPLDFLRVVGGATRLTQAHADRAVALAERFTAERGRETALAQSLSALPRGPLWSELVFSEVLRAGIDPLSLYRHGGRTTFFLKDAALGIVMEAIRARAASDAVALENLVKFVEVLSRAEVACEDNRKRKDLVDTPLVLTPRPPIDWTEFTRSVTSTHDISHSGH